MSYDITFTERELEEAERLISDLLQEHPKLNPSGWAYPIAYCDAHTTIEEVRARRKSMPRDHAKQFLKACLWIEKNLKRTEKLCTRVSSYGLKHIVEEEIGYIMNGVFIAAAIHCGFDYKLPDNQNGCQNLFFNLDFDALSESHGEILMRYSFDA